MSTESRQAPGHAPIVSPFSQATGAGAAAAEPDLAARQADDLPRRQASVPSRQVGLLPSSARRVG